MTIRQTTVLTLDLAVGQEKPKSIFLMGFRTWLGCAADRVHHTTADHTVANRAYCKLKFLVHFLGEMHHRLCIWRAVIKEGTRERCCGIKIQRALSYIFIFMIFSLASFQTAYIFIWVLHSVWVTHLIAKAVRTVLRSYSSLLPSPAVEAWLRRKTLRSPYQKYYVEGIIRQRGRRNRWSVLMFHPQTRTHLQLYERNGWWFIKWHFMLVNGRKEGVDKTYMLCKHVIWL